MILNKIRLSLRTAILLSSSSFINYDFECHVHSILS